VPEDDAMQDDSRKGAVRQGETFDTDTIEARMRMRIRETITTIVEEELEAALGAEKSARVGVTRHGYRHGARERTLTTPGTVHVRDAASTPGRSGRDHQRMAQYDGGPISAPDRPGR
jgi:hypothetical protein